MVANVLSDIFTPLGYLLSSNSARTVSPVVVLVAAISWTMVLKLRRGFPRQLRVIKENRRCSILFHLLVPGGPCTRREAHRSSRRPCDTRHRPSVSGHQPP